MTRYLIFGASRGLGAAFAEGLPQPGDFVWLISRSKPAHLDSSDDQIVRRWIQADLSQSNAAEQIKAALKDEPIDIFLYNAGIWESTAFSNQYDFEALSMEENQRVMTVNLSTPIHCIQALLSNLRKGTNPKIILIGSTSGQVNNNGVEVAYGASKFGLRGLAHSLRENLRPDRIPVTCINPGSIATEIPLQDEGNRLSTYQGENGILLSDLVKIVSALIALSPFTCVKEIDVPAMGDTYA